MLRGVFAGGDVEEVDSEEFRLRGKSVSRLESLTDAVFALAVTLLIVSMEAPRSFDQLVDVVKALPAFAASFALLMWFWAIHHSFCRRYGLRDSTTLTLNCALLFMVLYYVYPLKFLYTFVLNQVYGSTSAALSNSQAVVMFVLYGAGFGSVAGVYFLMHLHAWKQRDALGLNEAERILTRASIVKDLLLMGLAGTSILMAALLPTRWIGAAGLIYSLAALTEGFTGWYYGSRARRALAGRSPSEPHGLGGQ